MITGPLRVVLWVLGGLAMLPTMGSMMSGGMMRGGRMDEGMMGGGMVIGMGSMMAMMGMMIAQLIAMFGLVGVFGYLVIDSLRRRRTRPPRL